MRHIISAALAAILVAAPAAAQNDVCRDANGNVDMNATQGWQSFLAAADGQAMQMMVGTWYTEIPSPQTGQIAYRYQTYEPNGLFTMQTRVCDRMGLCSDYPGHGFWAARVGGQGVLSVMLVISDTQVTNYCALGQAMFQGNMMQDNYGQTWQRVQ